MEKKIIVISGGPGFGKTEIIKELKKLGYHTGDEFARDLIARETTSGGAMLPWKNIKKFQQEITRLRIGFYFDAADDKISFSDRGLPDQLAFIRYHGFEPDGGLEDYVARFRYFDRVFITPPWKKIYSRDAMRCETYEEACRIHTCICEVYQKAGYKLVEVSCQGPEERALFIIKYLRAIGIDTLAN